LHILRGERITRGRSTKVRSVRRALKKLREKERKQDIIYKTARIIEEIARRNNAIVVVGNVHKGKRKLVNKVGKNTLKHRIHQWRVSRLVEVLNNKPLHVVEVSEVSLDLIERDLNEFPESIVNHVEASRILLGVEVRAPRIIPARPTLPKPQPLFKQLLRLPIQTLESKPRAVMEEERAKEVKPRLSDECMDVVKLSMIILKAKLVETRRNVGIAEILDLVINKGKEENIKYIYAVLESGSNERVRVILDKEASKLFIEYQGSSGNFCGDEALHRAAKKFDRAHIAIIGSTLQ